MVNDILNSYKDFAPYLAYCKASSEKKMLKDCIYDSFKKNQPKNILDLGCGNGVNTSNISDLFPDARITGFERSSAQLDYARKNKSRENINYIICPFEEFRLNETYDFVLTSHVLQYIDSNLESFIEKAISSVAPNGELWIVQQTNVGLAQMIKHQKPYLNSPRFDDWKTFDDFKEVAFDILSKEEYKSRYTAEIVSLLTSIKSFNFDNLSREDKLRLEFIFALDNSYDEQSVEFKEHLVRVNEQLIIDDGRISHPNDIMMIKR